MPETNNLRDVGYAHGVPIAGRLDLGDPELVRIERIRYVGDAWRLPFDLSYAHGTNTRGERVRVDGLPYQVARGADLRRELYAAASEAGVRLNRLCGGHLDDVLSVLY